MLRRMDTKRIGDVSQLMVEAALLVKGYSVLVPIGDNDRYDFVIEKDGDFKKVQCKTGRIKSGAVRFRTCNYNRKGERNSYAGEVDYFGVYCPDNGMCYLVPSNEVGVAGCNLRVVPPRSNQRHTFPIRWADGYEL